MEDNLSKLAELTARLTATETQFSAFWNLSSNMFLISTAQGQIVKVNPAWTKVLGWSKAELEGKQWSDFIHPNDIAASYEASREMTKGMQIPPDFRNRYIHKDGGVRKLLWSGPAYDGSGLTYAMAIDITGWDEK